MVNSKEKQTLKTIQIPQHEARILAVCTLKMPINTICFVETFRKRPLSKLLLTNLNSLVLVAPFAFNTTLYQSMGVKTMH